MNKVSKSLLVLFLAFLLGSCFGVSFVQAQSNELILEATKECDFQYSGDSCIAELKITNNTDEIIDGEASLHIDYQGMCSNNKLEDFDGEGIKAQFFVNNVDWLNFSGWENGATVVSGFKIAKGETQPKLKIETVPNLCPGKYTFSLELKGEEYITPSIVMGGGGGGGYHTPPLAPIKGDINNDKKVDKYDFALLMANWGKTGTNDADLNGDKKVDKYDFALLMANWSE